MRKASLWAHGAKQGQGGQAGGDGVVWEGSWIVVDDGGAGRVRLSSRRHVHLNAPARLRVTLFLGPWTVSACRLRRG
jgi:hypothetical protein